MIVTVFYCSKTRIFDKIKTVKLVTDPFVNY